MCCTDTGPSSSPRSRGAACRNGHRAGVPCGSAPRPTSPESELAAPQPAITAPSELPAPTSEEPDHAAWVITASQQLRPRGAAVIPGQHQGRTESILQYRHAVCQPGSPTRPAVSAIPAASFTAVPHAALPRSPLNVGTGSRPDRIELRGARPPARLRTPAGLRCVTAPLTRASSGRAARAPSRSRRPHLPGRC